MKKMAAIAMLISALFVVSADSIEMELRVNVPRYASRPMAERKV